MTNVLIMYTAGFKFDDCQVAKLTSDYPQCTFTVTDDTQVTVEQLEAAEVIVGFVKQEFIKKAKNLAWLHLSSIGVDKHIDKSIYCNPNILLTNSAGTYGKSISDHILGFMIALSRNFPFFQANQSKALWCKKDAAKDLFGSSVCIIGLGDVGMELSRKLKALDMYVIAVKRTITEKPSFIDELHTTDELDLVLPKADFVVLCLATTPETVNLMNRNRLKSMKKDAYFINIGRGTLVDQEALYDCLSHKEIAGAAIDVTTPEPLPEDSPLWKLDNLIITPHCAGKSPSTGKRHFQIFHDELGRYLNGERLKNLIDFKLRY
ncbi:D-2-hydroxyacid dehydrogenase [uncultured Sphaerochaeta sp.]|uniref:D-2-hydroxyacid dehydrogenase n=1 Tax=uncultured Sphaerochaeta sp. TaxID=886478 RepID=UPI002A0A76F1|nr:D-2-hydroxyacid dehydrogenase [uncultured Sphaerochaeta sp.]